MISHKIVNKENRRETIKQLITKINLVVPDIANKWFLDSIKLWSTYAVLSPFMMRVF